MNKTQYHEPGWVQSPKVQGPQTKKVKIVESKIGTEGWRLFLSEGFGLWNIYIKML